MKILFYIFLLFSVKAFGQVNIKDQISELVPIFFDIGIQKCEFEEKCVMYSDLGEPKEIIIYGDSDDLMSGFLDYKKSLGGVTIFSRINLVKNKINNKFLYVFNFWFWYDFQGETKKIRQDIYTEYPHQLPYTRNWGASFETPDGVYTPFYYFNGSG